MFLYPIKQTTQRMTGAFENGTTTGIPFNSAPQESPEPLSVSAEESPADEPENDLTREMTDIETPHVKEATATVVPTPAQVVDEITATVEPDDNPDAEVNIVDNDTSALDDDQYDDSLDNDEYGDNMNDSHPDSDDDDQLGDGSDDQRVDDLGNGRPEGDDNEHNDDSSGDDRGGDDSDDNDSDDDGDGDRKDDDD